MINGFGVAALLGCSYMDHPTPFRVLNGTQIFHRFTDEKRTKSIWVGNRRSGKGYRVLTEEQMAEQTGDAA